MIKIIVIFAVVMAIISLVGILMWAVLELFGKPGKADLEYLKSIDKSRYMGNRK